LTTKEKVLKRGSLFCLLILFVTALVAGLFLVDADRGVSGQTDTVSASSGAPYYRRVGFFVTIRGTNISRENIGVSSGTWNNNNFIQDASMAIPNVADVQRIARARGWIEANATLSLDTSVSGGFQRWTGTRRLGDRANASV